MRHRKSFNHLSRKSAHRKAMLSNMACSLIMHKRINTTLAKARALRSYVEPLITKSKDDSTHSRRVVFSYRQSKDAVTELYREISVKISDRPGGYTRIIKTGSRLGDNAQMCMIELVDFNDNLLVEKDKGKPKTTRRRRGGSAGKKAADSAETQVNDSVETIKAEEPAKVVEEKIEEIKQEATVKTEEIKPEKEIAEVKDELITEVKESKVEEKTEKAEIKTEEPVKEEVSEIVEAKKEEEKETKSEKESGKKEEDKKEKGSEKGKA